MYITENGVDLPYLFLHRGSRIVASPAHTEKKKKGRIVTVDFCISV